MIAGIVNAHRQPIIRLTILNASGQSYEFDAVVDTGFNGSLTLPTATVATLGLAWSNRGSAILANGSVDECDIYVGIVLWDGQPRPILVEAADTEPLVGMRLMKDYRIIIEDTDGGIVRIERI
jgi:clan AA aspartic protease